MTTFQATIFNELAAEKAQAYECYVRAKKHVKWAKRQLRLGRGTAAECEGAEKELDEAERRFVQLRGRMRSCRRWLHLAPSAAAGPPRGGTRRETSVPAGR